MGSEGKCDGKSCFSPTTVADALPIHIVYVDGYWMDATDVTNADFDEIRAGHRLCHDRRTRADQEEFPAAPPISGQGYRWGLLRGHFAARPPVVLVECMATAAATFLLRENPGLRLLIIEKSTRFARRVGEATVEVSAFFIGIRLTNCTLKLKKDTRLQIVNPIPAKLGLVWRPDAALKAPALGRLRALFRVHLKIIRLSGPPALK